MAQPSLQQLLNTSWTLHRVSTLHHGDECLYLLENPKALNTYATRLRDQLTGDVLAGLHIASGAGGGAADEDDTLSKTGALKTCTWETISQQADDDRIDDGIRPASVSGPIDSRGILIVLEYENITYKAALLAGPPPVTTQREGSTALPLLVTRCPSPLRRTLMAFLSTNFDMYCSPSSLRLPSHVMCDALDVYVNAFLASDDDVTTTTTSSSAILQDVVKDMQITLSFPQPVAPALRSLNVNIPRASFGEFLRNPPSSGSHRDSPTGSSFLSSLSAYLEKHLAMKLDLRTPPNHRLAKQSVRLTKIACGGFVLGSEGKMKLVARAGDGDDVDDRDRLELRATEVLLREILKKAVVGDSVTRS